MHQPPTKTMGDLQEKTKQKSEIPHEHLREEEEENALKIFTCEICYEPMFSNTKFNNGSRCVHPFCTECMAKYIHVKVEDGVADVECPGLNCHQLLDPMTCRPVVPDQLFEKWCDNLCDSALLGVERCYCPNRDCSILVVNECGGVIKKEKCPNCKKLFCFKCKLPWHAGYRCEESGQVRDRNDVLFGQLVERKRWARCPRCGHCIELRSGCSFVRCRCKTCFCYNCGKAFGMGGCGCNRPFTPGEIIVVIVALFIIIFVVPFLPLLLHIFS